METIDVLLHGKVPYELGVVFSDESSVSAPNLFDRELLDRKSTRLNSSHSGESRMPSSA